MENLPVKSANDVDLLGMWQKRAETNEALYSPSHESSEDLNEPTLSFETGSNSHQRSGALTKAIYHKERAKLASRRLGKESLHGIVRGAVEAPVSGFIGGGRHLGEALKDVVQLNIDDACGNVLSGIAKPVLGLATAPYLLGRGIVGSGSACYEAAKHSIQASKEKKKEKRKKGKGKISVQEEELDEAEYFKKLSIAEERANDVRTEKEARELTGSLRSNHWHDVDHAPERKEWKGPDLNRKVHRSGGGGGGGSIGSGPSGPTTWSFS